MANNENVNKVSYNNSVLIDLTEDTITPEVVVSGYTAHDRSGASISGTFVPVTGVKGSSESSYRTGNVNLTAEDIGALPSSTSIPSKTSDLVNDSGFLTSHQDISGKKNIQSAVSDPTASGTSLSFIDSITQNAQGVIAPTKKTVPNASQSASGLMSATDKTKLDGIAAGAQVNSITGVKGNAESSYRTGNVNLTPANIGAIATSAKGAASGVAELDSNGKVPSSQLPSYVDDVLEYAKSSSFPTTGEAGKIYIAQDTNKTYRWSGTAYVEISASLALGTTSSTAYRGDYGNAAYTHAVTNKGSAFSSGLYKITTNSEGHVTGATAVAKSDITGLGIPGSDTTYTFDGTYNASTNKAATVSTVTNAIAALDGNLNDTTPGAGKTLTAFSETDGKVSATFGDISITKSQVSNLGTIGTAAAKGVDTSIAASSTSTNLPTSQAVAAFVEGKGYKTTDNNTTYSLTQDSSDGHKITLTPSSGTAQTITIPDNNTDTKVTSAANHYTPSRDTSADKSASASGATAAWSIDVVKGVTVQTDGKGHVTGVAVTSGKIPGNPNTDTHRPVQVNGTQALGNNTTALNLKAGSNVSITDGGSGAITIAATDTKYTAASAAPGNISTSGSQGSSTNYARQDHTHGISLATGDSNGQVKIAGSNVSVKGLGSAAYTDSIAYAAASHTHSGDAISGGYLNIHPENGPVLIPFMNNDIAYLLKRGGSAVIKYDGTTQSVDLTNIFDASPSYLAINTTNITTITIELSLHRTFNWTNIIYVDFGASAWRSTTVKIEAMNSNYSSDTWSQKYNNTSNSSGHCYVTTSHTPAGASNAGGGFNKIRFTFSGWNSGFRIAQLGVYNYGSAGLRETFLPRDGGALYGSIYPNSNNGANLGTTSQYFSNAYITNINGVAVGSSPKFTDTNTWRPVSDSVSSTSSSDAASSKAVKTAYDLAASKTANTGTVTSVATGVGLTGGTITGSGTLKAKLRSETALTVDSAAATTTSGRVYPVAVDKTGYLAVNVPWTDSKPVTSVAGKTGAVTLAKSDVGLGNVENKSSATIRGELTKANVTTALGYTPAATDTNTWRPIGKTSNDAASGNTVIADSTARTISEGTSSAYSIANLTTGHVVAAWRFSGGYTDNYPPADITVTTSNGSYTIQASNLLETGITMQPIFIKP